MSTGPTTYVALLRGINVGGHAMVSMAELKACVEALGFAGVHTYINSGNVIFRARNADPRVLEARLERALLRRFSSSITVVVRSLAEIDALLARIPASWRADTGQKCNVIFLRHTIDTPAILDGLHPKPGIEELHYRPGALFWSAPTSNLGRTQMVRFSRAPVYKEVTVRTLGTVRKIHDIMKAVEGR